LSEQQRSLAERQAEARKEVPHYHLTVDISLDELLSTRSQLNAQLNDDETLSVNDFLLKAAAVAMRSVPDVNASWMGNAIRQYEYVDLSLVVAGEAGDGSAVSAMPVLRDAQTKGLAAIAAESRALVQRTLAGELSAEDSLGGTFAVCNLGAFGVRQFTGILTPPQACLLSLGAAEQTVAPAEGSDAGYKITTVMSATLTCDHRVIDGAVGASWVQALRSWLKTR